MREKRHELEKDLSSAKKEVNNITVRHSTTDMEARVNFFKHHLDKAKEELAGQEDIGLYLTANVPQSLLLEVMGEQKTLIAKREKELKEAQDELKTRLELAGKEDEILENANKKVKEIEEEIEEVLNKLNSERKELDEKFEAWLV